MTTAPPASSCRVGVGRSRAAATANSASTNVGNAMFSVITRPAKAKAGMSSTSTAATNAQLRETRVRAQKKTGTAADDRSSAFVAFVSANVVCIVPTDQAGASASGYVKL